MPTSTDEVTEYPPSWKFKSDDGTEDGKVFVGRFTGVIETGTTAYGESPVAQFVHEDTGKTYSIWLFTSVLQDQLSKLAPVAGELVRIEYHGQKQSKSSTRKYQSFKATAPERPSANLSWGDLAADDEDEEI